MVYRNQVGCFIVRVQSGESEKKRAIQCPSQPPPPSLPQPSSNKLVSGYPQWRIQGSVYPNYGEKKRMSRLPLVVTELSSFWKDTLLLKCLVFQCF